MKTRSQPIIVNGRSYAWPPAPLVVICCDGSEPTYIEEARAKGRMPRIDRMIAVGENRRGLSAMPSFTNPNNLSIATGAPPAVHGICGNFLIDPDTGREEMMNDPKWLRAPTIFAGFQQAGARVAVVTAKDKLRLLLGKGLVFDGTAVCFSSERADKATKIENGIDGVCSALGMPVPDVYSAELSELVFAAGVWLLRTMRPDIMYLSTTDYIQHKHAPGTDAANRFYAMMDGYLGKLEDEGAIIVLVADHGMKDKHIPNGEPDVLYLQDALDDVLGKGRARVILPITDPYVVHHGALGSFATVYLRDTEPEPVSDIVRAMPGIDVVLTREKACRRLELPSDRLGDLVVISGGPNATKVIGTSRDRHDLSGLTEPLRSHGGLTEQEVPIIVNRRIEGVSGVLRNFDAFAIGCNHIVARAEAAE
jgi:phosphonoacetate hydrolase